MGAGPQQQPQEQAREQLNQAPPNPLPLPSGGEGGREEAPPNPLPPSGGEGGWGHMSENSGRKQIHTHLPMLTAGQF